MGSALLNRTDNRSLQNCCAVSADAVGQYCAEPQHLLGFECIVMWRACTAEEWPASQLTHHKPRIRVVGIARLHGLQVLQLHLRRMAANVTWTVTVRHSRGSCTVLAPSAESRGRVHPCGIRLCETCATITARQQRTFPLAAAAASPALTRVLPTSVLAPHTMNVGNARLMALSSAPL